MNVAKNMIKYIFVEQHKSNIVFENVLNGDTLIFI